MSKEHSKKKKLTERDASVVIAKWAAIAAWAYPAKELLKIVDKLISHR